MGHAPAELAHDYAHCRAVQRAHGVSYYFATRFFPPEVRRAVYALYGFVRYPDQWVDCPSTGTTAFLPSAADAVGGDADATSTPVALQAEAAQRIRQLLDAYERDFIRAVCGERVDLPPLRAFADVVRRYKIPLRYPLEFLDAMRMDLEHKRYTTFEELQTYTWGSASVVGVMMCYILGETSPRALEHAATMGLAMQMTNFLRDVGEDWQRGRVYLPQEELARFGISEAQIANGIVDDRWRKLMRFQIARCRELYAQAEQGICLLPQEVQYPVLLGSRLYARILDAIERNGYDVFRKRAHTTYAEKVAIAFRTYLEWRYSIATNRSASRV
ncbi:MAG: phytoene/squalene synthase family protein [Armatimonadota bacterium]|nr:phytoene/squalene synthase family protein [Armatimonadota bacterium]